MTHGCGSTEHVVVLETFLLNDVALIKRFG